MQTPFQHNWLFITHLIQQDMVDTPIFQSDTTLATRYHAANKGNSGHNIFCYE